MACALKIGCLLLLIASAVPAPSRSKQSPPVYDRSATVMYVGVHYDSQSHVTFPDGSTASMYCNYYNSSADCSTQSASGWLIRFDDGSEAACCVEYPQGAAKFCPLISLYCGHPMRELTDNLSHQGIRTVGHFSYRLVTDRLGNLFCVPYEVTDRKGRVHQGETCYFR